MLAHNPNGSCLRKCSRGQGKDQKGFRDTQQQHQNSVGLRFTKQKETSEVWLHIHGVSTSLKFEWAKARDKAALQL